MTKSMNTFFLPWPLSHENSNCLVRPSLEHFRDVDQTIVMPKRYALVVFSYSWVAQGNFKAVQCTVCSVQCVAGTMQGNSILSFISARKCQLFCSIYWTALIGNITVWKWASGYNLVSEWAFRTSHKNLTNSKFHQNSVYSTKQPAWKQSTGHQTTRYWMFNHNLYY